ncbi:hypothetical protein [Sphingomonas asaccharolytica]|uniref:hypothetical protein n=1 Tax=Sphingomonas asaccharolytica TaxID=40681 RepID=UPI000AC75686|nr:hypothetical protein [Sphingomonas asaccharolytica]
MRRILYFALATALANPAMPALAQQVVDPDADTKVANPAFATGKGPVVMVDSGHDERQTLATDYAPFGALLTHDGYVVRDFDQPISAASLAKSDVLVIVDPVNPKDPPKAPKYQSTSAFTSQEIATIADWVKGGGALLMIADHPPYAGGLRALAASFGFDIEMYAAQHVPKEEFFSFANGGLVDGPLTRGLPQIQTFYGAAFTAPAAATPLLRFDSSWTMLVTDKPPRPMSGSDLRGASLAVGKGRAVLLAEAGAWSAQLLGPKKRPMGFNAPGAEGNKRFIRNIVRWLATSDTPPAPATAGDK